MSSDNGIPEHVKEMMQQAMSASDRYKTVIESFGEYIHYVVAGHEGSEEQAVQGVLKAIDAADLRMKRSPRTALNVIEIDMCAAVAVKHPEKLGGIVDMMKQKDIHLYNGREIAAKHGIEDCLPEQLTGNRPLPKRHEWYFVQ